VGKISGMRHLVVTAMERVCFALDWPPVRRLLPWPLTRLACPAGLALWSSELDERWGTGVWHGVQGDQD
jgi:hypothetical protein